MDDEGLNRLWLWFQQVAPRSTRVGIGRVQRAPTRKEFARLFGVSDRQVRNWRAGSYTIGAEALELAEDSIAALRLNPSETKLGLRLLRSLQLDSPTRITLEEVEKKLSRLHSVTMDEEAIFEARRAIDTLLDQGNGPSHLDLVEDIWERLICNTAPSPQGVRLGFTHARLLIGARRFGDAAEVGKVCVAQSQFLGDRTMCSFALSALTTTTFNYGRNPNDRTPRDQALEHYAKAEGLVLSSLEMSPWALNHSHRAALIYVASFCDPTVDSPNLQPFIDHFESKIVASREAVDHLPDWRLANDEAIRRIRSVVGNPLDIYDEISAGLSLEQLVSKNSSLQSSAVFALPRIGTKRRLEDALELLEALLNHSTAHNHANRKVRWWRHIQATKKQLAALSG